MQRLALVVAVFSVTACTGDTRPERKLVPGTNRIAEEPHPADAPVDAREADPACAAKVKDLEPWLAALELERSSYEIEMMNTLAVINKPPAPVDQEIDFFDISPTHLEGFDASEANHADYKLGKDPTDKAIEERLAAMHGMANEQGDRLRIDVGATALWKDVVRVANAAQKAGYKEALFAFGATSQLTPPAGVEAWTTKAEDHDAASAKLKELKKQCKEWDDALLMPDQRKPPLERAQGYAKELAGYIVGCNCAANPDEVRVQMFKEVRWHQAHPHVGVLVMLGDGKTVTAPGKATWSDAHKQLLDAAAGGAPVKLAAGV